MSSPTPEISVPGKYSPNIVDQTEVVTFSSAQLLALHTTPITLVAAPGTGKTIIVDEVIWKTTYATSAYTGSNAIEIRYTDGSGSKVSADVPAAVLNISSGTQSYISRGASVAYTTNAAVVAVVPAADPAAGAGTATATVKYRIV